LPLILNMSDADTIWIISFDGAVKMAWLGTKVSDRAQQKDFAWILKETVKVPLAGQVLDLSKADDKTLKKHWDAHSYACKGFLLSIFTMMDEGHVPCSDR